ncbi:MauE/DoxX family redox-associated membrane protein [Flavobacterium sp. W1B]|uniref:MauE/DoxX family redox-associated membrane protein n=1 Tax=Flavobacterium sp. W1B TaxID=3394146 RepID=UPI0039BCD428
MICLLYILLFVYAAVSKLLDFENFQVQLGQSPLLSAFAGWVSWGVPIVELVIALLLVFPRFRLVGLYAAFSLMVMFTTYIYIILNFSPHIPCSCGGILEKLSWSQHMFFNILFIVLAFIAFLFSDNSLLFITRKHKIVSLLIGTFGSIALIAVLFLLSEDMIHNKNNFIRRFPHKPNKFTHEIDLKLNSYYIAGIGNGKIYLGNVTAPLNILAIDTTLASFQQYRITLGKNDLRFRTFRVTVKPPYFFIADGAMPCVLRGSIMDWKTSLQITPKTYFSRLVPIDSSSFAIRARDPESNENILGIITHDTSTSVKLSKKLLSKQIDGVFDTDGILLYNEQLDRIIYTYYYRNQFILADRKLTKIDDGHTIDTISKAQIKVTYNSSTKERQMVSPPLTVNKGTATFGNYLFVNSGLMGRYEPEDHWKRASVIDVYDLAKKTYAFSFYIPNKGKKRMTDFRVYGNLLVCLTDNIITTYHLTERVFDKYLNTSLP